MVPLGHFAAAGIALGHRRRLPDPLSAVGRTKTVARPRPPIRARRWGACPLVGFHRPLLYAPLPGGGDRPFADSTCDAFGLFTTTFVAIEVPPRPPQSGVRRSGGDRRSSTLRRPWNRRQTSCVAHRLSLFVKGQSERSRLMTKLLIGPENPIVRGARPSGEAG
jgi:hypothetical protein